MELDKKTVSIIARTPCGPFWESVGIHHHHGIDIALFSLRSEESMGIGEFGDLLPLLDFFHEVEMDVLQLLPLNDTGLDPSPYNAISAHALSPMYLSLKKLPHYFETDDTRDLEELNHTQRVNYTQVRYHKLCFLKDYFNRFSNEVTHSDAFKKFEEQHRLWLDDYALFKVLKMGNDWRSWKTWDISIRTPDKETLTRLKSEFSKEVLFHKFVQYLCFEQFHRVKNRANELGILIKGDIPILISPDSSDVWLHQKLFDLTLEAGAPPDMYTPDGQVWGFPLYHWDLMKTQGYEWWKGRLNTASDLYDIYRIDHIVGFFRIWAIPPNETAKNGFFIPEDSSLWLDQGRELMIMMIQSADMLPIGEDLGVVPDEIKGVLTQLGIPGTKVFRWEKAWEGTKRFISPTTFPPLSLSTVSTHDSETLDLWWRNKPEEAEILCEEKGWKHTPYLMFDQRMEILRDSHQSPSLFHINLLQEYLALFPELVWENLEDERINIPGVQADRNWSIRTRPFLHTILQHQELKKSIKDLIK